MRTAKFIDIIKSFGDYLRIDNKAGYKEDYVLEDLGDKDFVSKQIMVDNTPELPDPIVYNLPDGSETPVIINFADNTIKIGSADAEAFPGDLTKYKFNPTVKFKLIVDDTNSVPIGNEGWITNEEWTNDSYAELIEIILQPDTDTGLPGGLTLDNINIIIKA